jgi:hypothetical protein
MKKGIILSLVILGLSFAAWHWKNEWKEHKNKFGIEDSEEEEEEGNPAMKAVMNAARFQYEYDMLKDPKTGKIPANIYQLELEQAMRMPIAGNQGRLAVANGIVLTGFGANGPTTNTYQLAGPNNVAGRTRAFAFDKRYNGTTNKVIISGSVSGGLMRSTDGGSNWVLVAPDKQVHNLTCLTQDPKTPDTWYAGTGESLGNSASGGSGSGAFYLGNGVYKSTDNGASWSALTSTQGGTIEGFDNVFDLITRIVVNPVTGDVYVACVSTIKKSKDGGATWVTVKQSTTLGNNITGNTDVAIAKDGSKVYCAFHNKNSDRGVYQSTTGEAGSWSLIAGGSDNTPSGWKTNTSTSNTDSWGRIVLQLAPSNDNILYVLYENGASQASPSLLPEADLFKADFTSGAPVWTNLSSTVPDMPGGSKAGSDPLAVQGGYNMLLAVKPDDENMVFIGGTNLYRSSNGFVNANTTSWIGGYNTDFSTSIYPNSHPDMHFLVFDPTNTKRAFVCNDGGLQVTNDITLGTVVWTQVTNYQTLQYYSVAIDPETGKNNFEGGAQDNGTWYRDASLNFGPRPIDRPGINDYVNLLGGDGVAVDIAKINAGEQLTYFGVQSGIIVRDELLNNASYPGAIIRPKITDLIANSSNGYGDFITNFKLSNANSEVLFYSNYNRLFKTNSASTVDSSKWTRLLGVENTLNTVPGDNSISIRAMDFSWGSYQTTHSMYFGTNTGKLYRLDDYANANALAIPKDITPNGLAGNVSDIAVNPNDDNEILVVVSNYGVTSIFWTYNAKSATPSWSNAEGDLSLPSVRSCAIVTRKDVSGNPYTEYYVGTSVGLYSTQNIGKTLGASPAGSIIWSREGASVLNYAVISSLDYRPEDNTLLIGTHGNGMFYTVIGSPNFTPNLPTAITPTIVNDKNFMKIYPTVSTGTYQYQSGNITGIKAINVQVYNMLGQTVYQANTSYGGGQISLSRLPAGNYLVQITSDNKKYQANQKIIKQ